MVNSLCAWSGIILVCNGYLHSDVTFWWFIYFWDNIGLRFWCICFNSPIIIIGTFSFSWCNCWIFVWLKFLIFFFLSELFGVTIGMPLKWAPSEVLLWIIALSGIHFSFGLFLSLPIGVFLGIPPWVAPSEVLIGGLVLWIFPIGISVPSCVNLLVWIVELMVLDYVVHRLKFCICGGHFWHVDCFWGELYCVWYSFRSSFGDVCLMASVVLYFWSYVTAVFFVWCPWCSTIWPIVYYYSCPWWG